MKIKRETTQKYNATACVRGNETDDNMAMKWKIHARVICRFVSHFLLSFFDVSTISTRGGKKPMVFKIRNLFFWFFGFFNGFYGFFVF